MKVSLDWNCVIEAENEGDQVASVLELVDLHRNGEIEVALFAASASENNRSKRFPGSAKEFKERIEKLGWSDLPLVPMPAIIGLSFFDFSYWVGDANEFKEKFDELWKIIAPNVDRDFRSHVATGPGLSDDDVIQSAELKKWRNTWCDVMTAYCHIREKRDLLVTLNTSDFQRRSTKLSALGMSNICEPKEALRFIRKLEGD